MLSIEDAVARICGELSPLGEESVALADAPERVLTREVTATRDLPAFANSAMDGYAVRAADTVGASTTQPVRLRLVATVQAGRPSERSVGPGEAARIFTGAPLPSGADAVVMQEDTSVEGEQVAIRLPAKPGKHVRPIGEDVRAGALLWRQGAVLGVADVGMLAAQGVSFVPVVRRPRVAIVPTGDEVVEIDRSIHPGQVPNSNSHLIAAQVREAGGVPLRCPVAPDEPQALARALAQAGAASDLVITSGGVSVGDFDLVRQVLGAEGRIDFWKVAVKPGKPLAFGRLARTPLLGLPGNPVSSFVCFELFARPALRKLAGHTRLLHPRLRLPLATALAPDDRRRELVRARLEHRAGALVVVPCPRRGSAQLSSLIEVDALIDLPPGDAPLVEGALVDALVLRAAALAPG